MEQYYEAIDLLKGMISRPSFSREETAVAAAVALKNMPGALRSMTAVNGVLALIFGVVLLAFPLASTVWVTYLAAFYLIIYGVIALVLGFRLRKLTRN